MSDNTPALSEPIQLEVPIVRGETKIESLQLRRVKSGELRGLSMIDVVQLKTEALKQLLPRISVPPITEVEFDQLEAADLFALASEVGSFFLPKRLREESPTT